MKETELNGMHIDEAIEYAENRAIECKSNGFMFLACTYGGFHDALVAIKEGKILLEWESRQ